MRILFLLAAFTLAAQAETHTLTLKQAIQIALTQNPDIVMARLDEMKANAGIRVAHDPFSPHIYAGSGLAWNSGFPLSIEGSAPAVFQAKALQSLFNRPQTYLVAQARETARGAGIASAERRDEVVYRIAGLYIDADRAGRLADAAGKQAESLNKVLEAVDARVEGGRELPVARQEANVNLLRARQRVLALESDKDYAQHNLAAALGFGAEDTVQLAAEERTAAAIPDSEDAALRTALDQNKELKRLESNYQARGLEIKSNQAQRLPRVDLVAQYALLTRYSHYDEYFNKFQRHNGELGASIQVPLLLGSGVKAQISQAEADQQHIRSEIQVARNKITLEVHQGYQEIQKADMSKQVAKAELDLAHEQLSVVLAQMNEGRAGLRQVEEARFNEDEKWIVFYDAQFNAEKARLNVLRATGELTASLR